MKQSFCNLVVAALLTLAAQVAATPVWRDYEPEAFAAALESKQKILVDVAADWCPTCKAQHPILDELRADERLGDVSFVRVDYDEDKEFLRAHRVPRQSTILLFDGGSEVGRSIAETDRDRLRGFVFDALAE